MSDQPPRVARFLAASAENRTRARRAIDAFVACVEEGAFDQLPSCFCALELTGTTMQAFRAVGRGRGAPDDFCRAFAEVWPVDGDQIRDEVRNDLVLIGALRQLLPPYRGGPLTLYRGDSAFDRRRRTYGLSWTSSLDTATGFAHGFWRTFDGGSVVLKSVVPPDAIICALALHGNNYGEDEYLVDRRKLGPVEVLERVSQISPEEYAAAAADDLNASNDE